MALFTIKDLQRPVKTKGSSALNISGPGKYIIGKQHQKLTEIIKELPPEGECLDIVSNGDWSTHDLLFFILQKTGPAEVYFTTWAISEFAIRQLYTFVNTGLITKLTGIFDYRNVTHKTAELQFLKQITPEIKAVKIHAKVTVVQNAQWGITIVGSANYTRNPRIEAGVLRNSKKSAEFHKAWIMAEISNASKFERNN